MQVKDKIVVVTGGASGIGRALARRFTAEGARRVVIADLNEDGVEEVAEEIGAIAVTAMGHFGDALPTLERMEEMIRSASARS